jgi:hypothetical protein
MILAFIPLPPLPGIKERVAIFVHGLWGSFIWQPIIPFESWSEIAVAIREYSYIARAAEIP